VKIKTMDGHKKFIYDEDQLPEERELEAFMTFDSFADYLLAKNLITDKSWLDTYFRPEMKRAILHLARMSYDTLAHHPAVFEIFAVDFLLDLDLKLWFLEVVPNLRFDDKLEEKKQLFSDIIKGAVNMELELLYHEDLDKTAKEFGFEWVIDGRKPKFGRYQGLIHPECL
jgi:hypothetical protein